MGKGWVSPWPQGWLCMCMYFPIRSIISSTRNGAIYLGCKMSISMNLSESGTRMEISVGCGSYGWNHQGLDGGLRPNFRHTPNLWFEIVANPPQWNVMITLDDPNDNLSERHKGGVRCLKMPESQQYGAQKIHTESTLFLHFVVSTKGDYKNWLLVWNICYFPVYAE